MQIRTQAVLVMAAAGLLSFSNVNAAERPYHSSVSDIELEEGVKGTTYNKGNVSYFGGGSKKSTCCVCPETTTYVTTASTTTATSSTTVTAPATVTSSPAPSTVVTTSAAPTDGRTVKYILDGKPVYEDGAKGETGTRGDAGAPGEVKVSHAAIKAAIANLSNAGWRDAQATLVKAGKDAVPALIDALGQSGAAYNIAGHTKSDAGRSPRQLTIADVCAEILADIVGNRSTFQGEVPGADQKAWQAWWNTNGQSVTFGN